MDVLKSIALIGEEVKRTELKARLPEVSFVFDQEELPSQVELQSLTMVIDLDLDTSFSRVGAYAPHAHLVVLGGTITRTLQEIIGYYELPVKAQFYGMNNLPTCLNRDGWEVSCLMGEDRMRLNQILEHWGIKPIWVPDQVGMVSGRVLSLIINEAYIMIKEGAASGEAIDQGMKLGTNYPTGPIHWSQQIGLKRLIHLLDRLYEMTGEVRYVPARGLKEALGTAST